MVHRPGKCEQITSRFGFADDLLRRGVTFRINPRFRGHLLLLGPAQVAGSAEVDHFNGLAVLQEHDVVGLEVAVDERR